MFAPGDKLEYGHYTVLRELGAGGMGVVYHCRDEFLQREIAIKMLLPELMADDDTVEIFRQEARLAAQLEHPNIVTIHNIGIENKEGKTHHYIAMEFLPGGSLKQRIDRDQYSPLEQCLDWMKQMTIGLNYAHKRGVVHQDIKPDNVFITHEGNLKIGDFGLALIATGVAIERAVQGKGTPAYMSPELCRGDPQDHRSDIYSLGAVFFELLTREKPYKAAGMIEMAMKHATAPVPSAKKLNPEMPDVLDKVVQKMMAKAAEDRYQSLAEVLTILEKMLLEMQVARLGMQSGPPLSAVPPPGEPMRITRADGTTTTAAQPTPSVTTPPEAKTAGDSKPVGETKKPAAEAKPAAETKPATETKPAAEKKSAAEAKPAAKAAAKPAEESAEKSKSYADDFDEFISDRPMKSKSKPEPAKVSAKETAKKGESAPAVDPLDDLLDTLLSEQQTIESKRSAPATELAKGEPAPAAAAQPAKAEPAVAQSAVTQAAAAQTPGDARLRMPPNFHEDVTTDIDAVFQSRVRAEAAAMAQAAQAARDAAEIGRTVHGPAGEAGSAQTPPGVSGPRAAAAPGSAAKTKSPDVLWTYKTKGPIGWSSAPVVSKDRKMVFVGSADGFLYAFDSAKGNVQWRMDTGAAIIASPVIGENGTLFVGSTSGTLIAATGKGEKLWEVSMTSPLVATPVVSGNDVLVASMDGALKYVNGSNGNVKWTYRAEGALVSPPQILETLVFIASKDKALHAVSLDKGWRQWIFQTEAPIVSSPLVSTDSVYIGSTDGHMYAVEAESGKMIWRYSTENPIVSKGTLEFTSITVCSEDKWVHCIEKYTGILVWKSRLHSAVMASLTSNAGNLYVANREGWLQCFSLKNGNLQWQMDCHARLESPPVVSGKTLYLGTVSGEITAYTLPS